MGECVLGNIPVPRVKTTHADTFLFQPSAIKSDLIILAQEPLLLLSFFNSYSLWKLLRARENKDLLLYSFNCYIFFYKLI